MAACLLLGLLAALGAGFTPAAPAAYAGSQFGAECPSGPSYMGRSPCYGYFTGQYRQAPSGEDSKVFNDGIYANSADEYMSILKGYLYGTNVQNVIGAATIVDVMLGQPGPSFGGSRLRGVDYAKSHFDLLSQIVHQYEANGDIDWHYTTSSNDPNNERFKHVVYDPVMHDTFYKSTPFYVAQVIRFNVPKGGKGEPFQIERSCGNLIGNATGLQTPPQSPPQADLNPPTPPRGKTPPGFDTGDPALYSSCSVISGHAFDPRVPSYAVQVRITYSTGGTDTATASTAGDHPFQRNTPDSVRASVVPVQVSAVAIDASGKQFAVRGSPITIGPCSIPDPVCGSMTVNPPALDPETPFSVTASVSYDSAQQAKAVQTQPGFRFYMGIAGPGVNSSNDNVSGVKLVGSSLQATVSWPATHNTGTYAVSWGTKGAYGARDCGGNVRSSTFIVADRPYFAVHGGDSSAGDGMSIGGVNCALAPDRAAGIVSWNRGSDGGYAGAGSQYAGMASGRLQDFATGQGSGLAPDGLSFANTAQSNIDLPRGLFGGQLASSGCTPDYFAQAHDVQTGNITIDGRSVPNGGKQTIYVRGNAYITGDITYSGSYGSVADIPTFRLVVQGNIYIAPGVKRLDGFYIAQPSGPTAADGVIYSCATAPFTAAGLDHNLHNDCGTPLTVEGAFAARQVWLLRIAGTVSGAAAESFDFTPEVWLSGSGTGGQLPDGYDAITSLPPIL